MPRIACIFAPCFPLAARLRAEPDLSGKPVVICRGNGTAARVVAVSRAAWRFGLRPGTTLAQARSRLPDVIARAHDAVAEKSAAEALLEAAATLSPRIENNAEDRAFADISGMERLFPGPNGEAEIGRTAMLAAEVLSLIVQVGIADTKLAARIAASGADSPTVIPAGEEAAFLAPLPLTRLDLPIKILETLGKWGIQTAGQLARLPGDRVSARLGPAGEAAHRIARGDDPEPLVPHHPPATLTEGQELEWPVVTIEPLLAILRPCLERTHLRLAHQDLACSLLELELRVEPEGVDRRLIRLPAPARDIESLVTLIQLELEARPPEGPIAAFRCIIHPDRPRTGQLTLFGPPEIQPDRMAITLARLAARLGPDRVGSPRIVNGHLPERTTSVPFNPPPPPKSHISPRRGRGLLAVRALRPPVPLEVIVKESSQRSAISCQEEAVGSQLSDLRPRYPLREPSVSGSQAAEESRSRRIKESKDGRAKKVGEPIHPHFFAPQNQRQHQEQGQQQRSGAGAETGNRVRDRWPEPEPQTATESAGSDQDRVDSPLEHSNSTITPSDSSFDVPPLSSSRPISVASETGATPHIQGLVRVAAGPWGLEEGWWKDEPVVREYWDVELSGGGLYRIYRDCRSNDWFGDGIYD